MKKKLTDEMINNIKNYSSKIETIDDYTTAVRQTIGYHIGSAGTKGHLTMIKEIIQNSFDEAVRKDSPCDHICVTYDERINNIIVEDNGRGIPFNDLLRVYTSAYTSSNYTKEKGDYTAGTHGSGSKITLALSEFFRVESYILGEARYIEAHEGHIKGNIKSMKNKNNKQGTLVSFRPSSVMGQIDTTCQDVYNLFFGLFPLIPIGTTVIFRGIDKAGNLICDESRTNTEGIIAGLISKTVNPLIPPVMIGDDNGNTKVEIAFTYDTSSLMAEDVSSFSNFCITLGGTHKDGFIDAICNYFRNYMNKIYLGGNSKLTILNIDIKTGLKAVVNAAHLNPIFNAQAKEFLTNRDMYDFVKSTTTLALDQWIKVNPNHLQKLCKFFKEVAETRIKSDDVKIKLTNKYQTSALSGKPKKFIAPTGNKHTELVIVEGDSAYGSAKNSRCTARQGLFPIRGKIPNAFSTEKTKFLSNSEIASIITIVGGGYGKNFDISKVKWEKIILMADADPDGAHINSLLLRFFLLYMPEVITNGKLYKSVPPLYGIIKKTNSKYFTNTLDFTRYVQGLFTKNNIITDMGNRKLTNNEITKLFVTNIDYLYEMGIVSGTYAIVKKLLEDILIYLPTDPSVTKDYNKFKKFIESNYRFVKVSKTNGVIAIDGLVDEKIHTIYLDNRILSNCRNVLQIMNNNESMYYKVNGQKMSIYEIMVLFDKFKPNNVTRYKGLGEQNPKDLAKSALHPDGDRVLIQYTVEDIKKEIEIIRYLESDKSELLKNIIVTRQDVE